MPDAAPIEAVEVRAYTVPTDAPESDGTFEWNATTLVVAGIRAGGESGLGYTYADTATATLIRDKLGPLLHGKDALDISARWIELVRAVRNLGRAGIASMAISALDVALWDLKAKRLGVPLGMLLAPARRAIRAYGSGGFTSYSLDRLREQLGGWARDGLTAVKMKVGRDADADLERVKAARDAVGGGVELFVDANGAYSQPVALRQALEFALEDVRWFEEPVSSDDLEGLRLLRTRRPPAMAIAAGEYGYDSAYFRRMLAAGAVDTLQADATRCGGVTGFLDAAALADAFGVPLSSHCAPALHVPLCCAARRAVHLEYFHDHVRIERMLFDGAPALRDGALAFDASRPGHGLELKERDAECYRA
ncbi:MAG TPA: enolase C-terminal domain-like protein [Usitatibacter sp.]|jgi:L-alanine-DL-glutamate epimerase-like enolase superfamily enzyme|nr:enolase C-terminal domain-like protein [Usitatibacter sp.]